MSDKKRAFRVGRLDSVKDVVAETAKLYRRTVHGHVPSDVAQRHSSILANIRQGMEQSLIELRLTTIEDQIMRLASSQVRAPLLNSFTVEPDQPEPKTSSED